MAFSARYTTFSVHVIQHFPVPNDSFVASGNGWTEGLAAKETCRAWPVVVVDKKSV